MRQIKNRSRTAALVLAVTGGALLSPPSTRAGKDAPGTVEFNRDIRPLLSDNCFACHGPDEKERQAGLRLDTKDGLFGRLDDALRVVFPGEPRKSELYLRVSAAAPEDRMPPAASGKSLSPAEVERLRRWIEQGARWQGHWSFTSPRRPAPPPVRDSAWIRNEIDRFILERLEREGLEPAPQADKRTLIRRLGFDLIGLPPMPAAVDAFVADEDPDAYERLVDELLASPHHGERMAMYWLDLVRYADTVGYHGDQPHNISPYRDYVIDAFHRNMRFDRFTIEQLAGDLLPAATLEQKVASGYNRLNMTTEEGGAQPGEYLAKYAADRVRATSTVWMGATLGCAECHDHKFDPYTTKDFYSFAAFFADLQEVGAYGGGGHRPPELGVPGPEQAAEMERLDEALAAAVAERSAAAGGNAERAALEERIASLKKQRAALEKTFRRTMVSVAVKPRTTRVLKRGNWMDDSGEVVTPAVPHFMSPPEVGDRRATRLDLARWLVSREHPQTARVFVNRLWKLFFGRGLSRTLDDTGSQGEWPRHLELLDWLAVEFMESGWNVRHMVKLLVMSNTYRRSSLVDPRLHRADPENRLHARQARFRIDAEMVRDTALAVSGLLVRDVGGRSVKPYQPAGYYAHLNFPKRVYKSDDGRNQYRRGLYTHWQRTFLHPTLLAFDAPSREECTAERAISNTPKAALALLNDPTFVEAARVLAARILDEGGDAIDERLEWAYCRALSRAPDGRERELMKKLYRSHLEHYSASRREAAELLRVGLAPVPQGRDVAELAAWTSVARVLLNLNETITRN